MAIPKIVVGDIVQVVLESRVANQRCLNVLHYRAVTVDPAAEYLDALDALMTKVAGPSPSVGAYMLAAMSSNAELHSVRAQRVSPVRDVYVAQGIGTEGALVGAANTANLAGVITKQSQTVGRGRNGSFLSLIHI